MRLLMTTIKALVFGLLGLTLVACALHISNSEDASIPPRPDNTLRLATYNVHYIILDKPDGSWSLADWDRRKAPMDDAFKALNPDVIAFQEMESFAHGSDGDTNLTLDYLLERNPDYAAAAVGPWRDFPSTQPILYRKTALRPLDQGWFFFSDTPDVIYSRTFNGSYPAFASWAKFAPAGDGKPFYVVNMHFEYKSRSNRLLSAALVRDRVAPFVQDAPVFLVGDLNARSGARTLDILEETGVTFAPVPGSTYHFNRGINLFGAIDHIGLPPGATAIDGPKVLQRRFRGEWPTDHYPVYLDVTLP